MAEPRQNRDFLDPQTVSQLSSLSLVARLVVEGFITGLHRSPYHGFSVEFAEHRQYMPGDDMRYIVWKVYGETDKYFVKEYEEETNLKAYLLLDASGSMGYTSHTVSKLDYSIYLSAALAHLMLKQRDAVGLVTFDDRIKKYMPPRSINSYLAQILQTLKNTSSEKETNISNTLHEMAERINRRGLIILFSDLMDDPDKVISGLKHFRHKKHEVVVFHVLDPMERSFDFKRDAVFQDMETREQLSTQPWHIRKDYRKLMQDFIDTYKRQCLANNIDYVLLNSEEPFDRALLQYLIKRKRIGG